MIPPPWRCSWVSMRCGIVAHWIKARMLWLRIRVGERTNIVVGSKVVNLHELREHFWSNIPRASGIKSFPKLLHEGFKDRCRPAVGVEKMLIPRRWSRRRFTGDWREARRSASSRGCVLLLSLVEARGRAAWRCVLLLLRRLPARR